VPRSLGEGSLKLELILGEIAREVEARRRGGQRGGTRRMNRAPAAARSKKEQSVTAEADGPVSRVTLATSGPATHRQRPRGTHSVSGVRRELSELAKQCVLLLNGASDSAH
jgi:hypothetical protein